MQTNGEKLDKKIKKDSGENGFFFLFCTLYFLLLKLPLFYTSFCPFSVCMVFLHLSSLICSESRKSVLFLPLLSQHQLLLFNYSLSSFPVFCQRSFVTAFLAFASSCPFASFQLYILALLLIVYSVTVVNENSRDKC